jgi:hypothetical protein
MGSESRDLWVLCRTASSAPLPSLAEPKALELGPSLLPQHVLQDTGRLKCGATALVWASQGPIPQSWVCRFGDDREHCDNGRLAMAKGLTSS